MLAQRLQTRQHLFIDGDDTLWYCNRYYESAFQAFEKFLNHSSLTLDEVRVVLSKIDAQQGCGATSFTQSLRQTYQLLTERQLSTDDLDYRDYLSVCLMIEQQTHIPQYKRTSKL